MSESHLGWFRVEEAAVRKLRDTYDRQSAYRLALMVYVTLCRIGNLEGLDTFTRRIASIAADAGLSYNATAEGLELVKSAGLLTVVAKTVAGSKERAPSEYQLVRTSPTEWGTSPTENGRLPKTQNSQVLPRVSKNCTKNFYQELHQLPFQSDAFAKGWANWLEHLKQKRKSPTPLALEKQLGKCKEWGEARSLAAFDHSIQGNYQGLFEPNNANGMRPKKSEPDYGNII